MARKSNKTAHVLNLLSGGEPEKEVQQPQEAKTEAETTTVKEEPEPAKAEAAPTPAPTPAITQAAAPEVPSNISIIDNGAKEADAVAEQIHEELLKELEREERAAGTATAPVAEASKEEASAASVTESPKTEALSTSVAESPNTEVPSTPVAESSNTEAPSTSVAESPETEVPSTSVAEPTKAEAPSTPDVGIPKVEASSAPVAEAPKIEAPSTPIAETAKEETASTPAAEEPKSEPEEVLELSPEPPVEPEPDFVMLNVMQRVVEDKIIYFMKQFEVCTCDRCKADTIALTLSGLPSKYRIVDKHAVDPLVSYYTGRLISQVTVEALKACTQVKDNPRH